jgi:hypothetical protein
MAKKIIKKLGMLFCLAGLVTGIAAFAACGGDSNKDDKDNSTNQGGGSNQGDTSGGSTSGGDNTSGGNTSGGDDTSGGNTSGGDDTSGGNTSGGDADKIYVFEAEYTYMNDVVGGGISGAAAGLNMITESSDASDGFFISSMHTTDAKLTFKITASAACTATLRLKLANELSAMKMNPNTFEIKVNGVVLNYAEFTLPEEVKSMGRTFGTYKVGDIELKEGENVITFQVADKDGSNEYCNGGPGGPMFDCITLKPTTAVTLTMEEYRDNVE